MSHLPADIGPGLGSRAGARQARRPTHRRLRARDRAYQVVAGQTPLPRRQRHGDAAPDLRSRPGRAPPSRSSTSVPTRSARPSEGAREGSGQARSRPWPSSRAPSKRRSATLVRGGRRDDDIARLRAQRGGRRPTSAGRRIKDAIRQADTRAEQRRVTDSSGTFSLTGSLGETTSPSGISDVSQVSVKSDANPSNSGVTGVPGFGIGASHPSQPVQDAGSLGGAELSAPAPGRPAQRRRPRRPSVGDGRAAEDVVCRCPPRCRGRHR